MSVIDICNFFNKKNIFDIILQTELDYLPNDSKVGKTSSQELHLNFEVLESISGVLQFSKVITTGLLLGYWHTNNNAAPIFRCDR